MDRKFYFAKAKNFLCFGPDGVEIDLREYKNIILILGENLDAPQKRSNGAGKSSIPEIIVYALYGKTIKKNKKIKHQNVIHNKIGKKLHVEVCWDNYRVVRTRKPDGLRLWESENGVWDDTTEITLGSKAETQKKIESILGMNYDTFVNVVMFTDNNAESFLECDSPEKRKVVENLLLLEIYREFAEIAKTLKKELDSKIKFMLTEYDRLLIDVTSAKTRVNDIELQENDWKNNLRKELRQLLDKIEVSKKELQSTKSGEALSLYQTAKEESAKLLAEIQDMEKAKNKLDDMLQTAREKLDASNELQHEIVSVINNHKNKISDAQNKIEKELAFIKDLKSQEGATCTKCLGQITSEHCSHAEEQAQVEIDAQNKIIEENQPLLDSKNEELEIKKNGCLKLKEAIKVANEKSKLVNKKLTDLRKQYDTYNNVPKPDVDSDILLLQQEIESLVEQAKAKKETFDGDTPFVRILKSAREEVQEKEQIAGEKKQHIEEIKVELPYYEFWVEAFGDSGIRKFVIEEMLPALNDRISYWMDVLFDGIISLEFDSEFNETIQTVPPNGNDYVYHTMSGGERRTLNLSVAHSFAHIMMMSSGAAPSYVFLDEVSSNIDSVGVEYVYNMICELSKEKQVFVTTHNQRLLELLSYSADCDTITMRKKDGITKMLKAS